MQVSQQNLDGGQHTLTSVFQEKIELAFILSQFLSLHDLLLKVGLLSKRYQDMVLQLQ